MPLYLYPNDHAQAHMDYEKWPKGVEGRIPNLAREFVRGFAERIDLTFVPEGRGDLKSTFGPEDVLDYIYAVLHSPAFRTRYAAFLRVDFPRISFPRDRAVFCALRATGQELTDLHLMKAGVLGDDRRWPAFPEEGSNMVEGGYPKYVAEADTPRKAAVYINKAQCFRGVHPDVWEFHIGGYRTCEKWLKYRSETQLSYDDVNHFQKIVVALE